MTDQELLELAYAYGITWGTEAATGRPRVTYVVAGSVVDVEIVPDEYEVRLDAVAATRDAIERAMEEAEPVKH